MSLLKSGFHGGENIPLFVLFDRPSGLTAGDRGAVGRIGTPLQRLGLDGATPVFDPLTTAGKDLLPHGLGLVSPDGQAAIIALGINAARRNAVSDSVARIHKSPRTVAVGLLLDTFVVRALLVPSLTHLLGDRAWWPFSVRSTRRQSSA